jgi:mRNA-degrading endonuclease RelE of RelBE toxin-antitoxin system
MQFLIADTFTDSLARLPGQEQKAVKTTAFDLQLNPANPGLRFHKLDRAKDPNFHSVRVNADVRLIVHRTAGSLLLAYVGHHDDAYAWAERRKIERHPQTGAAQMVEVRERVQEIAVMPAGRAEPVAPPRPHLFDALPDTALLAYGVPPEWLADVRQATEDTLLDLAPRLPQEAAEALLNLATGTTPPLPAPAPAPADPFAHPDAQRRFRVVGDSAELERALDFPWEKWTVFLHPTQRQFVERSYAGPARIYGSAGTGKTIVALHRAVFLARRNPGAHVLLTTFSTVLANALKARLHCLAGNEPDIMERITIGPIAGIGHDLYARRFGEPDIASADLLRSLVEEAAAKAPGHRFPPHFLMGEWIDVVDARQLRTWEAYRDVARLGRKTRVGGRQREVLWSIFAEVRQSLAARTAMTWPDVFGRLADAFAQGERPPFDHAVVDEAQDIGVAELRFLAALSAGRPDALFFAGDLGQRIFQQPFSWKSLGVDVRGRSHILSINYRTSQQIRACADRLLPSSIADVDGNAEGRRGTISVLSGPVPVVTVFDDARAERDAVGRWIAERLRDGMRPEDIAVLVRSPAQIERARVAVQATGARSADLNDKVEITAGRIALGTMHLAKGLEFRAVAVMACDDGVLPLEERIESVADDADLEEVYDTERHLLYVACTRARDFLLVTAIEPGSEFLVDFRARLATVGP